MQKKGVCLPTCLFTYPHTCLPTIACLSYFGIFFALFSTRPRSNLERNLHRCIVRGSCRGVRIRVRGRDVVVLCTRSSLSFPRARFDLVYLLRKRSQRFPSRIPVEIGRLLQHLEDEAYHAKVVLGYWPLSPTFPFMSPLKMDPFVLHVVCLLPILQYCIGISAYR